MKFEAPEPLVYWKPAAHMASTQIETVSTGADKAKLALAGVLVLGGLAAFYLLSGRGPLIQWGGLIGALVLAVIAFFTSESGRQLGQWRRRWPVRSGPRRSAQRFRLEHRGPFRFCGAAR